MIQEIILTKSIKNIRYSDGRDHSDLETKVKDICHDCGYVYH